MQRLHPIANRAARGLFERLCGRTLARRPGHANDSPNQRQSARASAFYCYVTAGLSAAAAVVAWFILPSPFLILFTAGCALVLLISGLWYGRAAQKQNP